MEARTDGAGRKGNVARAHSAPVLSLSTVAFALMVYGLITALTVAYQLTQSAFG